MDKQEIKITDSKWPVIIKESGKGDVEAECPLFPDCKAKGDCEDKVLQEIEFKITRKIEETRSVN